MHPGSDRERHLALEYDPIIEAGELALVMMLVTDRTEQVLLERAAAEREQAHARQLERMRRMAAGGGQMFVGFLRGAAQRFAEIRDLLESKQGQLAQVDVEFLFRHAHTVKGEARTYDLEDLGAACHRLEDRLQELRSQAEATGEVDASPCIGELKVNLDACSGKLDAARGTLIEASPIGAAILEQVTVQRSDVQRLQQCLSTLEAEKGELDPSLREVASRLASRPLGELAAGISDNADRWARGLGKRVVLQVRGRDCLIPPELARVLPGALTHLIRNAVDHAVEKPEAREAVGKDDFGSIVVEGRQGSCGPIISVRDDGRGIDAERLRSKAEARGIPYTAGSEVELIFSDGMSTRDEVSDLSGRGVGMSAVKAELGDVGYAIAIATEPGKGTTFCLRSVHATGETDFPEELQAVS